MQPVQSNLTVKIHLSHVRRWPVCVGHGFHLNWLPIHQHYTGTNEKLNAVWKQVKKNNHDQYKIFVLLFCENFDYLVKIKLLVT